MTADKNLTPQAIRAQLVRIFQNTEFKASDKQRRFLSFVVEETLEGRTSQIKGYTIAVAVYGRKASVFPVTCHGLASSITIPVKISPCFFKD